MRDHVALLSHYFPGITPHPAGRAGSVWDLDAHTYLSLCKQALALQEARKQAGARRR